MGNTGPCLTEQEQQKAGYGSACCGIRISDMDQDEEEQESQAGLDA